MAAAPAAHRGRVAGQETSSLRQPPPLVAAARHGLPVAPGAQLLLPQPAKLVTRCQPAAILAPRARAGPAQNGAVLCTAKHPWRRPRDRLRTP